MSFNKNEKVELGKCIELIIDYRGKTPKKMGGDWVKQGVKTISAKNVHGGELTHLDDIRFVSNDVYKKWMKDDIKRGDCLLVSEGATLGENMYWDSNEKIVLGQRLFCIRTNNNVLDSKYFSAYMNTRDYQKEIDGRATGTSVLGLRQTELLNTKVALRPIDEQRFIGNLYYMINKKIEVNKQVNKKLEAMAQSIFKNWFVDFEFPNENGEPYKSSGGEMEESELGMIPKGWEVISIKEIMDITTKSIKPQDNEDTIYEHYSIPALDDKKYPVFEYGKEIKSNKYKVYKNSILISKLNPKTKRIWRPLNLTDNAICSTEFINYVPKKDECKEFCYSIINSEQFNNYLVQNATGSTNSRQRVKPKDTYNLKIAYPSKGNLVSNFINIAKPLLDKADKTIIENKTLEKTRDTLLPKLMSGEIRVPVDTNQD